MKKNKRMVLREESEESVEDVANRVMGYTLLAILILYSSQFLLWYFK
jgi:hypothetical protein